MDGPVSVLLRALAGVQLGQATSPPHHWALWGLLVMCFSSLPSVGLQPVRRLDELAP